MAAVSHFLFDLGASQEKIGPFRSNIRDDHSYGIFNNGYLSDDNEVLICWYVGVVKFS